MKYAITGHTAGIGRKLFERLSPNVIGFSLSSGYDITNINDRKKIITESKDCDVFINNATAEFAQTLLFLELFNEWKDQDKTIINVGSRIAEITVLPRDRQDLLKYQAEKLILKEMNNRVYGRCKVKYKWFGYVGTEKILKKYPHFTPTDYITEDQAADIILS
jgi:hypothetical protein